MINKIVLICMLIFGMHQVAVSMQDLAFEPIRLPIYPPRIQILDAYGKQLAPTTLPSLEYRELEIGVPYRANTQELWMPKSMNDAASVLGCMLPKDFYLRLKLGIDEFMVNGEISDDPAVSERVGDVAIYLAELWNLDSQSWVGDETAGFDEFHFLSRILANKSGSTELVEIKCE